MPKQVVGRAVAPPPGWKFEANGQLIPDGVPAPESFDTLYAWAKEKKYGLTPTNRTIYNGRINVSWRFIVHTDSWDTTTKFLGNGKWVPKRDVSLSIGTVEYIDPRGVAYWNSCGNCGRAGVASWRITGTRYCAFCVHECENEGCGEKIPSYQALKKCDKCEPSVQCILCGGRFPEDGCEKVREHQWGCKTCVDARRCVECGEFNDDRFLSHNRKRMCEKCYGTIIEKERLPHEKFTKDELPLGGSLVLGSLSNRPVRVISIETEVDGDALALANTLYNEGLVREGFVESYGAHCPDDSSWPAFLKYDGSVSGGELINFMLELDKKEHAESLCNILSKLRSLEKLNKVAYNANCGGHIHIDAHNFSSDNVWRLLTGYNYLEDVIFRLAGSGHSYGHRTLVEGHDAANAGRGYSHPTAKGPWGIKSGAYRAAAGQDRMTGLNFQPYLRAVQYCSCGAGVENLRSCKCVLPKCTIEWRVWNSQGNPRILHGWLAFMQALHAWADSPREMTDAQEKDYPALAWTQKKWGDTSQGHQKLALERIEWIFKNLVFTESEKDSLVFAFKQTDISFPAGFWAGIAGIATPKNRTVKTPRNCSNRVIALAASKPDRKVYGDPRNDPNYVGGVNRLRVRADVGANAAARPPRRPRFR